MQTDTESFPEPAESAFVMQHLRSIIIHSLDSFNFANAEFACERLLAMDLENLDSTYLYNLTLFRQGKYKSCYAKMINSDACEHLGCVFILGQCCLKLQRYKEGIYHLLKLNYLYNESSLEEGMNTDSSYDPFFFVTPSQKYHYEFRRKIMPDSSMIYHLLGDLYRGMNDVKNSALNYAQALKFNQYDFEAFQELCKLGSVGSRGSLKRNTSTSLMPNEVGSSSAGAGVGAGSKPSILVNKEIEKSDKYLYKLYIIFAKSFKSMSKYDCYKAIRLLVLLPEREKETPWVLSKLGRLHFEIVNYKQSEYYFIKLRKLDRTRLEDMEYYSTLLWHLHRKVELTYLANELHDLDTESPITWCTIGNLLSLTREPDEAIKCFNKAIKLDDSFTYAYTLKGHEYFGNDNYEMALENFRMSLLIDSRHYNALYGIGMVYINLGDYQKADYHFRKAVSINPINIILICCVGMVLEKLNKKHLALRQYELANKLQPTNPLPIFKMAQLLFSMQQYPQALKYFEILKDLAPDEASVHFLLGQLYNVQNDKFSAIREFTIALNLDPKGNYLIGEAMESLKDK
ncbi:Anaphase promoting complex subunit CDC27 (Cell division control protein 27) (Anaphase promoting complex subunit 3) [Scheffersomyces stipitis CBS 6054]|uniref:Anaphase promoting complex subunit CDC27 (Cell division control protein 27) (Anaphase promoting complex subunit 3) n=1 Tax=Scheffersomyces stipitis (strain ATCC 58785 / CBS 6054 / NBRC 10063 / NRRL Y-11545) TaxID=322104 RepID=A3M0F8_PICST|nr:Anaphase promoting complex subunit CDC27 (Cell division control protein 27) (Anaphase promoting complex subunit 3) [Scheffersomyces stipitis CBS 6054]ABN68517.2 Anaphase promoting complex subunit CDC27 (Cell division control protein 27) (Anaphase promoting complex subunit 3) [Scheffersomyces stipitis CBS 6054]